MSDKLIAASRRRFIKHSGLAATLALTSHLPEFLKHNSMKESNPFDAIVIGGSYSGLSAAMALGRALKNVLVIDSGKPCNAPTPHSHNFLTQDGNTPSGISAIAKKQVQAYDTIRFLNGLAVSAKQTVQGFELKTATNETFRAAKLIFATGITDMMPNIDGFTDCWGKSVLHCPYCHGYEVSNSKTGIMGNGELIIEYAQLISNWTKDLTLYTNGKATFTSGQRETLYRLHIDVVENEIAKLEHDKGYINHIVFAGGTRSAVSALYAPRPFEQHCKIPESLGCAVSDSGHIQVDMFQETSIPGVYACGDNTSPMRSVAHAVAMGTTAGIGASRKLIFEKF